METRKRPPFYWRAFVTFSIVTAFLVIALSGAVLYVAPPGRVVNWSEWRFAWLQKASWQAVHTIFALIFIVAAGVHIYFNWRVIVSYVKTRLDAGIRRGRELALSCGLAAAVLALTLAGVPPARTVMTFGETLKNSWVSAANEPPVPHAEMWTLAKLAETTKIPLDRALENLRQKGIATESAEVTLIALAGRHGVTPQAVYQAAVGDATPAPVPPTEGGGYGRRTVEEICTQGQVPVATGLERLRRNGIEATPQSNIRELATKAGKRPMDIVTLLLQP